MPDEDGYEVEDNTTEETQEETTQEEKPQGGMAEESETTEESKEEEEKKPESKDRTPLWMKKEIFAERQRRRDAEAQLEQLKKSQPQSDAPTEEPEEPDEDKYEDVDEYKKAHKKWRKDIRAYDRAQLKKELRQETAQTSQQNEITNLHREWAKLETDFNKTHEDYYDVVHDFREQISSYGQAGSLIYNTVLKSRNPELVYHLGNNPELVSSLGSSNDPLEITMRIGEINAGLGKKEKHVSKKPEPIKKPKGGQGGETGKPRVEDSDEEWIRKRELAIAKKRGIKVA